MSTYASFQGRVFLGKRDTAGLPIEVRSPGNVAELKLSLKTDVLEHYESQTGQRSLDHRMVKQKSATVNLTIEEFTKENLALALYGNHVVGTAGSVTAEPFGGDTPVVGDRYFLAHPRVSSLVVTDSAGTPATLTAGALHRRPGLRCRPVSGYHRLHRTVQGGLRLRRGHRDRHLHAGAAGALPALEGINTAQGNAKVLVELYRVAFDPLKEISFISDEYNKFELEGSLLADTTKPYDAVLGQFGRIVQRGRP
jgi:hypothetical protein